MSTPEVKPDPDALERLQTHRRRPTVGRMKKLALLLSLLALGALGLVACGGSDDDQATAASETEATRDRTSCGYVPVSGRPYPLVKVAVIEGNVSCRVARGVIEDLYRGKGRLADAEHAPAPFDLVRGSWRCGGTDRVKGCTKAQRTPSAKTIRAHARTNQEVIGGKANEWAAAFAKDALAACRYYAGVQPSCERAACQRVGHPEPIKNCTPPSSEFRESFANTTVERVVVDAPGATVEFSNGESVQFQAGEYGRWYITKRWIKKITTSHGTGTNPRLSNEERIEQARNEWAQLSAGRHAVTEEGVSFSFRVPTVGWERFSSISTDKSAGGPISINKSMVGPQGAEAIIFWTSFPDGDYADPCAPLLSPSIGSSADLAAALSTAPGTKVLTGPSNATVGGRPAKHVALTVRERHVGCDPGFFYTWRDVYGGALWPKTRVGDTIRVWIVDVHGTRLFIEAETIKVNGFSLEREVQQIVKSIRFE